MPTKITKEQYISNPCGVCATAYWKSVAYKIPDSIQVVHQSKYNQIDNSLPNVESYFRLIHNLKHIQTINLLKRFYFVVVDIHTQKEQAAELINKCYDDISVDIEQISSWTATKVFDNDLWLFIYDINSNKPIALGIADYDTGIKEGSLEWIQVLQSYRGSGLGVTLVNELLRRLKEKGAKFVTVSGKVDNVTKPEQLYRKCGFTGNDIWFVVR